MSLLPLAVTILLLAPAAPAQEHPGATIYKKKGACATCHGNDGSGNTPAGKSVKAGDLRSNVTQSRSDAELAAIIADGKGKMPQYSRALTPQQIKDVVGYIRLFAPAK